MEKIIPRAEVEREIRNVHLSANNFYAWLGAQSAHRGIVGLAHDVYHCPICFYLMEMCLREPSHVSVSDPIIRIDDPPSGKAVIGIPTKITIYFELGIEPIEINDPPEWVSWFVDALDTSYSRPGPRYVRAKHALDILDEARRP